MVKILQNIFFKLSLKEQVQKITCHRVSLLKALCIDRKSEKRLVEWKQWRMINDD